MNITGCLLILFVLWHSARSTPTNRQYYSDKKFGSEYISDYDIKGRSLKYEPLNQNGDNDHSKSYGIDIIKSEPVGYDKATSRTLNEDGGHSKSSISTSKTNGETEDQQLDSVNIRRRRSIFGFTAQIPNIHRIKSKVYIAEEGRLKKIIDPGQATIAETLNGVAAISKIREMAKAAEEQAVKFSNILDTGIYQTDINDYLKASGSSSAAVSAATIANMYKENPIYSLYDNYPLKFTHGKRKNGNEHLHQDNAQISVEIHHDIGKNGKIIGYLHDHSVQPKWTVHNNRHLMKEYMSIENSDSDVSLNEDDESYTIAKRKSDDKGNMNGWNLNNQETRVKTTKDQSLAENDSDAAFAELIERAKSDLDIDDDHWTERHHTMKPSKTHRQSKWNDVSQGWKNDMTISLESDTLSPLTSSSANVETRKKEDNRNWDKIISEDISRKPFSVGTAEIVSKASIDEATVTDNSRNDINNVARSVATAIKTNDHLSDVNVDAGDADSNGNTATDIMMKTDGIVSNGVANGGHNIGNDIVVATAQSSSDAIVSTKDDDTITSAVSSAGGSSASGDIIDDHTIGISGGHGDGISGTNHASDDTLVATVDVGSDSTVISGDNGVISSGVASAGGSAVAIEGIDEHVIGISNDGGKTDGTISDGVVNGGHNIGNDIVVATADSNSDATVNTGNDDILTSAISSAGGSSASGDINGDHTIGISNDGGKTDETVSDGVVNGGHNIGNDIVVATADSSSDASMSTGNGDTITSAVSSAGESSSDVIDDHTIGLSGTDHTSDDTLVATADAGSDSTVISGDNGVISSGAASAEGSAVAIEGIDEHVIGISNDGGKTDGTISDGVVNGGHNIGNDIVVATADSNSDATVNTGNDDILTSAISSAGGLSASGDINGDHTIGISNDGGKTDETVSDGVVNGGHNIGNDIVVATADSSSDASMSTGNGDTITSAVSSAGGSSGDVIDDHTIGLSGTDHASDDILVATADVGSDSRVISGDNGVISSGVASAGGSAVAIEGIDEHVIGISNDGGKTDGTISDGVVNGGHNIGNDIVVATADSSSDASMSTGNGDTITSAVSSAGESSGDVIDDHTIGLSRTDHTSDDTLVATADAGSDSTVISGDNGVITSGAASAEGSTAAIEGIDEHVIGISNDGGKTDGTISDGVVNGGHNIGNDIVVATADSNSDATVNTGNGDTITSAVSSAGGWPGDVIDDHTIGLSGTDHASDDTLVATADAGSDSTVISGDNGVITSGAASAGGSAVAIEGIDEHVIGISNDGGKTDGTISDGVVNEGHNIGNDIVVATADSNSDATVNTGNDDILTSAISSAGGSSASGDINGDHTIGISNDGGKTDETVSDGVVNGGHNIGNDIVVATADSSSDASMSTGNGDTITSAVSSAGESSGDVIDDHTIGLSGTDHTSDDTLVATADAGSDSTVISGDNGVITSGAASAEGSTAAIEGIDEHVIGISNDGGKTDGTISDGVVNGGHNIGNDIVVATADSSSDASMSTGNGDTITSAVSSAGESSGDVIDDHTIGLSGTDHASDDTLVATADVGSDSTVISGDNGVITSGAASTGGSAVAIEGIDEHVIGISNDGGKTDGTISDGVVNGGHNVGNDIVVATADSSSDASMSTGNGDTITSAISSAGESSGDVIDDHTIGLSGTDHASDDILVATADVGSDSRVISGDNGVISSGVASAGGSAVAIEGIDEHVIGISNDGGKTDGTISDGVVNGGHNIGNDIVVATADSSSDASMSTGNGDIITSAVSSASESSGDVIDDHTIGLSGTDHTSDDTLVATADAGSDSTVISGDNGVITSGAASAEGSTAAIEGIDEHVIGISNDGGKTDGTISDGVVNGGHNIGNDIVVATADSSSDASMSTGNGDTITSAVSSAGESSGDVIDDHTIGLSGTDHTSDDTLVATADAGSDSTVISGDNGVITSGAASAEGSTAAIEGIDEHVIGISNDGGKTDGTISDGVVNGGHNVGNDIVVATADSSSDASMSTGNGDTITSAVSSAGGSSGDVIDDHTIGLSGTDHASDDILVATADVGSDSRVISGDNGVISSGVASAGGSAVAIEGIDEHVIGISNDGGKTDGTISDGVVNGGHNIGNDIVVATADSSSDASMSTGNGDTITSAVSSAGESSGDVIDDHTIGLSGTDHTSDDTLVATADAGSDSRVISGDNGVISSGVASAGGSAVAIEGIDEHVIGISNDGGKTDGTISDGVVNGSHNIGNDIVVATADSNSDATVNTRNDDILTSAISSAGGSSASGDINGEHTIGISDLGALLSGVHNDQIFNIGESSDGTYIGVGKGISGGRSSTGNVDTVVSTVLSAVKAPALENDIAKRSFGLSDIRSLIPGSYNDGIFDIGHPSDDTVTKAGVSNTDSASVTLPKKLPVSEDHIAVHSNDVPDEQPGISHDHNGGVFQTDHTRDNIILPTTNAESDGRVITGQNTVISSRIASGGSSPVEIDGIDDRMNAISTEREKPDQSLTDGVVNENHNTDSDVVSTTYDSRSDVTVSTGKDDIVIPAIPSAEGSSMSGEVIGDRTVGLSEVDSRISGSHSNRIPGTDQASDNTLKATADGRSDSTVISGDNDVISSGVASAEGSSVAIHGIDEHVIGISSDDVKTYGIVNGGHNTGNDIVVSTADSSSDASMNTGNGDTITSAVSSAGGSSVSGDDIVDNKIGITDVGTGLSSDHDNGISGTNHASDDSLAATADAGSDSTVISRDNGVISSGAASAEGSSVATDGTDEHVVGISSDGVKSDGIVSDGFVNGGDNTGNDIVVATTGSSSDATVSTGNGDTTTSAVSSAGGSSVSGDGIVDGNIGITGVDSGISGGHGDGISITDHASDDGSVATANSGSDSTIITGDNGIISSGVASAEGSSVATDEIDEHVVGISSDEVKSDGIVSDGVVNGGDNTGNDIVVATIDSSSDATVSTGNDDTTTSAVSLAGESSAAGDGIVDDNIGITGVDSGISGGHGDGISITDHASDDGLVATSNAGSDSTIITGDNGIISSGVASAEGSSVAIDGIDEHVVGISSDGVKSDGIVSDGVVNGGDNTGNDIVVATIDTSSDATVSTGNDDTTTSAVSLAGGSSVSGDGIVDDNIGITGVDSGISGGHGDGISISDHASDDGLVATANSGSDSTIITGDNGIISSGVASAEGSSVATDGIDEHVVGISSDGVKSDGIVSDGVVNGGDNTGNDIVVATTGSSSDATVSTGNGDTTTSAVSSAGGSSVSGDGIVDGNIGITGVDSGISGGHGDGISITDHASDDGSVATANSGSDSTIITGDNGIISSGVASAEGSSVATDEIDEHVVGISSDEVKSDGIVSDGVVNGGDNTGNDIVVATIDSSSDATVTTGNDDTTTSAVSLAGESSAAGDGIVDDNIGITGVDSGISGGHGDGISITDHASDDGLVATSNAGSDSTIITGDNGIISSGVASAEGSSVAIDGIDEHVVGISSDGVKSDGIVSDGVVNGGDNTGNDIVVATIDTSSDATVSTGNDDTTTSAVSLAGGSSVSGDGIVDGNIGITGVDSGISGGHGDGISISDHASDDGLVATANSGSDSTIITGDNGIISSGVASAEGSSVATDGIDEHVVGISSDGVKSDGIVSDGVVNGGDNTGNDIVVATTGSSSDATVSTGNGDTTTSAVSSAGGSSVSGDGIVDGNIGITGVDSGISGGHGDGISISDHASDDGLVATANSGSDSTIITGDNGIISSGVASAEGSSVATDGIDEHVVGISSDGVKSDGIVSDGVVNGGDNTGNDIVVATTGSSSDATVSTGNGDTTTSAVSSAGGSSVSGDGIVDGNIGITGVDSGISGGHGDGISISDHASDDGLVATANSGSDSTIITGDNGIISSGVASAEGSSVATDGIDEHVVGISSDGVKSDGIVSDGVVNGGDNTGNDIVVATIDSNSDATVNTGNDDAITSLVSTAEESSGPGDGVIYQSVVIPNDEVVSIKRGSEGVSSFDYLSEKSDDPNVYGVNKNWRPAIVSPEGVGQLSSEASSGIWKWVGNVNSDPSDAQKLKNGVSSLISGDAVTSIDNPDANNSDRDSTYDDSVGTTSEGNGQASFGRSGDGWKWIINRDVSITGASRSGDDSSRDDRGIDTLNVNLNTETLPQQNNVWNILSNNLNNQMLKTTNTLNSRANINALNGVLNSKVSTPDSTNSPISVEGNIEKDSKISDNVWNWIMGNVDTSPETVSSPDTSTYQSTIHEKTLKSVGKGDSSFSSDSDAVYETLTEIGENSKVDNSYNLPISDDVSAATESNTVINKWRSFDNTDKFDENGNNVPFSTDSSDVAVPLGNIISTVPSKKYPAESNTDCSQDTSEKRKNDVITVKNMYGPSVKVTLVEDSDPPVMIQSEIPKFIYTRIRSLFHDKMIHS